MMLRSSSGASVKGSPSKGSLSGSPTKGLLQAEDVAAAWTVAKSLRTSASVESIPLHDGERKPGRQVPQALKKSPSVSGGKFQKPRTIEKVPSLSSIRSQKKFEQVQRWVERQDSIASLRKRGVTPIGKAAVDQFFATGASAPNGGNVAAIDAFLESTAPVSSLPVLAPPSPTSPLPPIISPKKPAAVSQRTKDSMSLASNALNNKFTDMFKAFQQMDMDRSGQLDRNELKRALEMMNIPMDDEKLDEMIAVCDPDSDGQVSYIEFVDALARDTVAPAALGKRGMQAKEIFGETGFEKRAPPKGFKPEPSAPEAGDGDNTKQLSMAREVLNNKFTDMFKAFQFVDLDRSGRLNKAELKRALDMWNVPIDDKTLDALMASCDSGDGDGEVDYKEFVDALARDTVAPAALGKRGMQAKEIFGETGFEKRAAPASALTTKAAATEGGPPDATTLEDNLAMASNVLNNKFTDMFKAFQYVDLDHSGKLDKNEIRRALDLWNVPLDDAKLTALMAKCDPDGDDQVSYAEFVDALARDSVAPAALGKRGMQAKEIFGTDGFEKQAPPKAAL